MVLEIKETSTSLLCSGIIVCPSHPVDPMEIWPEDAHVLTPKNFELMTFHGQKEFCRCELVKDLEVGDDPWLSGWLQCHHCGPYAREVGGSRSEKVML